jgi:hypothetical protein
MAAEAYMARVHLFYTGYMTNIENKQLQIYLWGTKLSAT